MSSASPSLLGSPHSIARSESSLDPDRSSGGETWSERFLAALPLFVVGVVCVAAAVYLFISGAATTVGGNGSVHLRPWILFLALGISGLSAGTIALFAEETTSSPAADAGTRTPGPSPSSPASTSLRTFAPPHERHPTSAFEGLPSPAGVPAARTGSVPSRPSVTSRIWDESDIAVATPSSIPKDLWDESPEEFEAAASRPAPPEVVLNQLDELEASLRKKPGKPRTE